MAPRLTVPALLLLAACASGESSPPASTTADVAATATAGARVDLEPPTFTNPTTITHPLFPVTAVEQVVSLGTEEGDPLRIEVTPLSETRVIEWDGRSIEAVVSQFVAYRDLEIVEVALDWFAQADDGSVWYLGEEVDNYEHGEVADHEGSWEAGVDGPGGMIMPADPQVGDVYHPENIPDLVFEEVTVLAVDETFPGPGGPVEGAIRVEEHLMEGTLEQKVFAPGYGEFQAEAPDELVTAAVAVPTDAHDAELPAALEALAREAGAAAEDGLAADLDVLEGHLAAVTDAPPLVADEARAALDALAAAVEEADATAAAHAAFALELAALDLQLPYRPLAEVDAARLDAWTRRLARDTAAGDDAAAASDRAVIATLQARMEGR